MFAKRQMGQESKAFEGIVSISDWKGMNKTETIKLNIHSGVN